MGAAEDWYQSPAWDEPARELFASKLARARPDSRAGYLTGKGFALLQTSDVTRRAAGAALLQQVLDDHPDLPFEVAGAHALLGMYHESLGDGATAAGHYRRSLAAFHHDSYGAGFMLAELIVREDWRDAYEEADALLDAVREEDPPFMEHRFRYAVARARLADRRGARDEAAAFALGALVLWEGNAPVSHYHPTVGLIHADDPTLAEMEELATRGDGEGAFADLPLLPNERGPDGRPLWDWEYIKRFRAGPDSTVERRWRDARDWDLVLAAPVAELRAAGFDVEGLSPWVGRPPATAAEARRAAAVLVHWLETSDDHRIHWAILGILGDPRARAITTDPMLDFFRSLGGTELNAQGWIEDEDVSTRRSLKELTGRELSRLLRDDRFDDLVALIRDPIHGPHRLWLVEGLGRSKRPEAVDVALSLLDDDVLAVRTAALRTLGNLRSERARPILEEIAARPRPRQRGEEADEERYRIDLAKRGLAKLEARRRKEAAGP